MVRVGFCSYCFVITVDFSVFFPFCFLVWLLLISEFEFAFSFVGILEEVKAIQLFLSFHQ